jgi:hypothetical protein
MNDTNPLPTLQERCLALNLPGVAELVEHWSSSEQADLTGTYIKYVHPDDRGDPYSAILDGTNKSWSIQVGPFSQVKGRLIGCTV